MAPLNTVQMTSQMPGGEAQGLTRSQAGEKCQRYSMGQAWG